MNLKYCYYGDDDPFPQVWCVFGRPREHGTAVEHSLHCPVERSSLSPRDARAMKLLQRIEHKVRTRPEFRNQIVPYCEIRDLEKEAS